MTTVQVFFYKIFEKLNSNLFVKKVRLEQSTKAKYSILASILHIFVLFFLTEPHIYLYNTMCKSHGFHISCFESGNIFLKM